MEKAFKMFGVIFDLVIAYIIFDFAVNYVKNNFVCEIVFHEKAVLFLVTIGFIAQLVNTANAFKALLPPKD